MLIPFEEVCSILEKYGKKISGILHIGAHNCEEKEAYNSKGIEDENIYWIEALSHKVEMNKQKGILNIYEAVIYNEEETIPFYVSKDLDLEGNAQSSSILPFLRHLDWYPQIRVDRVEQKQSITLKNWIEKNTIPIERLNFWSLDIQGTELQALMSADEYLKYADFLYVEVNVDRLYENVPLLPMMDSFLEEKGFKRVEIKMALQGWGDALYVRFT